MIHHGHRGSSQRRPLMGGFVGRILGVISNRPIFDVFSLRFFEYLTQIPTHYRCLISLDHQTN